LVFDAEHTRDVGSALAKLDEAARIFSEELGDAVQAAETLSRALERVPGDTALLGRMVEALVAVGETERALTEIGKAIESAPEAARAGLLRVRGGLRVREFPQSADALELAVADLQAAVALASNEALEIRGELSLVLDHLRGLYHDVGDDQGERAVVLRQASLLPKIDDSFEVLETLASWLREHPLDTTVAVRLGELATDAEDHGTAAFAYARLLDASEGDSRRDAVLKFADAAENAGTAMVARSALEAVQRENPSDETLRQRLRQMYEVAGAYAELGEILHDQAQQSADPEEKFRLYCEAGELFLKAEVGAAACEIFQRALELKPDAYGVVSLLGDAYLALGEVDSATRVLEQAVEAHGKRRTPELSLLQHGLARVARMRGDENLVISLLEAALLTDRQNGHAASDLAVFAQERGMFDTAIKALQLVTLLKTPAPMSRAEAYLRQAIIANQQGDAKKAVLLARRATAADPDFAEAHGFLQELGG
jgi:tetratricopeptide (TPR) repeat protein